MKKEKLVLLASLFIIFLLFTNSNAVAAPAPTFGCTWNVSTKICKVKTSPTPCSGSKDYVPDETICGRVGDPSTCNSQVNSCRALRTTRQCPPTHILLCKKGDNPWDLIIDPLTCYVFHTASTICCARSYYDTLSPISNRHKLCQNNPSALANPTCPTGYTQEANDPNKCILEQVSLVDICAKLPADQQNACYDCTGRPWEKSLKGTYTALGCIKTDPSEFISWVLKNAIGLGGGIAFLLMIFGAFQIIISGGDPEKLNNGKEILTSAIAGLLMIIFSVLLLKIIGYDILRIPGITLK